MQIIKPPVIHAVTGVPNGMTGARVISLKKSMESVCRADMNIQHSANHRMDVANMDNTDDGDAGG